MDLKVARRIAGLTQQQLADRAGIDNTYLCLLENGQRDIASVAYIYVLRLANALNVDARDLFPLDASVPLPPFDDDDQPRKRSKSGQPVPAIIAKRRRRSRHARA